MNQINNLNICNNSQGDWCVTADTLIFTNPHGAVYAKDVTPEMWVYAFDGGIATFPGKIGNNGHKYNIKRFQGELSKRKVLNIQEFGKADIYEIKTGGGTIKGTYEHPILTVKRDKDGKHLVWTKLGGIKHQDIVMMVKKLPATNKTPKYLIDEMRFYGFFIGDGMIRRRKEGKNKIKGIEIYCANETEAVKYQTIIKNCFPSLNPYLYINKSSGNIMRVVRIDNTLFGKKIEDLGFSGTAHTKRVPKWIFNLTTSEIKAFLEGYIEADGSICKNGAYDLVSCNKNLIEDCIYLAKKIGWWTSNIYARNNIPGRFSNKMSYFVQFYHYFDPKGCMWGPREFFRSDEKYFTAMRVRSIKKLPEQEIVYDITVDNSHNFVANGFISHDINHAFPLGNFTP